MPDGPEVMPPVGQGRLIASGSLVQQASQVSGLLAMLAIVTVLGRRLPLDEFGVYGLLTSLAGYLLVIQNSAASAGVRAMAAATDDEGRAGAFSTATLVYALAGLATGVLVAVVGFVLALAVDLSPDLRDQAKAGAVALGAVTAVGWPITVARDALRARQLFVRAAVIEIGSLVAYVALVLALVFAEAPLWLLIAGSGTIPLLSGLGCAIAARLASLPFRFSRAAITHERRRDFARLAFYVSITEAAGTLIYALDRVILGLFKSAATVGLYEGPVRAHNVLRSLNAAVTVVVLPSASKYVGEGDRRRLGELLTRGTRYTMALIVPLTVTMMVLAPPLLEVWLGHEFRQAGLALAILASYWLVNGSTGVSQAIIVAAGQAKVLARYAWIVAPVNVALSIALTPWLGLEGVVIGTAVPYFAVFPFVMRVAMSEARVSAREFLRHSAAPAWSLGAALAAALGALRLLAEPDSLREVLVAGVAGIGAYWAAYYALWLSADERRLVRDVAGDLVPGGWGR